MACLIFGHSQKVLSLRGSICLWISSENFLEALYGLLEPIKVKFHLAFTENNLGNEIFWWEITNEPVVLIAIQVKDDNRWSPFDSKSFY